MFEEVQAKKQFCDRLHFFLFFASHFLSQLSLTASRRQREDPSIRTKRATGSKISVCSTTIAQGIAGIGIARPWPMTIKDFHHYSIHAKMGHYFEMAIHLQLPNSIKVIYK